MKNITVILSGLVLFLFSCKRTNKDGLLGPETKAASANFQVLDTLKANYFNGYKGSKSDTISFQYIEQIFKKVFDADRNDSILKLDRVNFYKRKTFYKVKFNQEVSWNLRLTKFSDGKLDNTVTTTISGTSSFLDSTNSSWDGKGNGFLFAKGDFVIAELSFVEGSSLILRDTSYISKGEIYNSNEAKMLVDFEDGLINTYTYNDNKDSKPSIPPYIDNTITPPQGSKSLLIFGSDNNGDYFVGGMNIQKLDTETMKNYDPKDIYINMYIYGYPSNNSLSINKNSTKLNIGISEDDVDRDDNFDPEFEDTFEKQISVDWVGWKLISVRYSELVRSASKTAGGSGNGKFEPGRAYSANCNLISSPNGSIVGANIDYVIITYGKPFDASNL